MYSVRVNQDFCFTEQENEKNKEIAQKIVLLTKENNLTFIQAMEVLEQSKVELQMQLIG